jgi:hypothetical protein
MYTFSEGTGEPTMEATIAKIKKNASAEVWVCLREYQGTQFVDVREHFLEADSREWLPTRKGIMLQPELLPKVIDALEELGGVSDLGTVATIPKSPRQEIQVGYREFGKSRYGEIRLWYTDGKEMKPSPKGVTFRLEHVDSLLEALRVAEDQLENVRETR